MFFIFCENVKGLILSMNKRICFEKDQKKQEKDVYVLL